MCGLFLSHGVGIPGCVVSLCHIKSRLELVRVVGSSEGQLVGCHGYIHKGEVIFHKLFKCERITDCSIN